MKIFDLLLMSMSNLWKRKLRTILTVLGVVIGITSIVVMVALGNGLKQSMLDNYQNYSSMTQIRIYSGSYYGYSSNDQNEEKNWMIRLSMNYWEWSMWNRCIRILRLA